MNRSLPALWRLARPRPKPRPAATSAVRFGQAAAVSRLHNMAGLAQKYEINADMGEGFGKWKMGPDEELMPYLDAANIACGFHAGDPTIMLQTIRLCKKHGVRAGAHPGLADLFGFGRRPMQIDPQDMYAMVLYQVGALKAMLDAEGVPLAHIKPHGELFFYMLRDEAIMRAVLAACATFGVPLYACQNPQHAALCREYGVPFQGELYVDVDYSADGHLIPVAQSQTATPALCYERARAAMMDGRGRDAHGAAIDYGFAGKPFSICVHSDMATVLQNVRGVRKAVDEANAAKSLS